MKPSLLFIFVLYFFLPRTTVAQTVAPLHQTETIRVHGLSFFEEDDSLQTINTAAARFAAGGVQTLSSLSPNFGRSPHRYWLSFTVEALASENLVLELSNAFLYNLELYNQSGNLLYKTGINYPFAQRPVRHRRFAFPLSLHNGSNTFFLLADRRDELLRFSLTFYSAEGFAVHRTQDALFFGAVFGVLFFIAVFSLALRVVLRDSVHGWYVGYILLMCLFLMADNGFGYQWLWPNAPGLQKYVRNFLSLGAFAVQLRFMQDFLQQTAANSRYFTWVRRTVAATVLLLMLLALYVLLHASGWTITGWPTQAVQVLFYATFLSGIALLMASTWQMIARRRRSAAIYLLAMLPMVVQMLVVMASRWHLLQTDVDTAKFFAVAVVLEVVTLGCGLLLRYYALKKEKEMLALQLHQREQALLQNVLDAQNAERKRIAEDLHDQLGGTLSAVKGMLSSAPATTNTLRAQAVLDEACDDLRFIAHGLMPTGFAQQSLATALAELAQKASMHKTTAFQFLTHGLPVPLPKQTELTIFRMANELLQNIIRHAGAREATVQLLYFPTCVQLMVEDDGRGFNLNESTSGIGLKNLFSRAKYINATLCYDSGPEGTTAICTIPLSTTS